MKYKSVIDFHIHILSGLDDGPAHWEKSLNMAKIAVAEGTTAMVVTPHYIDKQFYSTTDKVSKKIREFKKLLSKNNIPLDVYSGSEIRLFDDLPRFIKEGIIPTINNTHYILIELPFGEELSKSEPIIDKLRQMRIVPILVHPERHHEIREQSSWLIDFIQDGGLIQVNSSSLTGDHGEESQKFAENIVSNHWVHLLGSDAHGINKRKPGLSKGIEKLFQLGGEDWANFMISYCPKKVLAGLPIHEILISDDKLKKYAQGK